MRETLTRQIYLIEGRTFHRAAPQGEKRARPAARRDVAETTLRTLDSACHAARSSRTCVARIASEQRASQQHGPRRAPQGRRCSRPRADAGVCNEASAAELAT